MDGDGTSVNSAAAAVVDADDGGWTLARTAGATLLVCLPLQAETCA